MLTTINGGVTYAANSANRSNGGNQYNFGDTAQATKDASSIALENSINIPPTLTKNQGDNISIFVARDLDFRGCMTSKQPTNAKGSSLLEYLRVLQPFLNEDGVTEVVVNKPGEVITEGRKGWQFHNVPKLDFAGGY
ncbi:putative conjugal transfer protein TriI [Citrobacter koseri]|uniref:Putative conjugal transfer protein TriI n=1 Tax=Citrobacter koseri TaxID=545 RepID=A0A2X2WKH1_CITKO|nr:putative conjugal transfer protein TriI [Citrobacter koseri]